MKRRHFLALAATAAPLVNAQQQPPTPRPAAAGAGGQADGEAAPPPANQTMKQLVRGTDYAATSMMPQSTLTAEHMLRAGGNAFDAVVAGQGVLGLAQPAMNGVGSDATLLVYDAKAQKVFSINAEGTAPQLATIEWYKANQGGKIPLNDSLLADRKSTRLNSSHRCISYA